MFIAFVARAIITVGWLRVMEAVRTGSTESVSRSEKRKATSLIDTSVRIREKKGAGVTTWKPKRVAPANTVPTPAEKISLIFNCQVLLVRASRLHQKEVRFARDGLMVDGTITNQSPRYTSQQDLECDATIFGK